MRGMSSHKHKFPMNADDIIIETTVDEEDVMETEEVVLSIVIVNYNVKYFLEPGTETVETTWGPVRVKTARGHGAAHAKPEYDDVAELARENGVPYGAVYREALGRLQGGI